MLVSDSRDRSWSVSGARWQLDTCAVRALYLINLETLARLAPSYRCRRLLQHNVFQKLNCKVVHSLAISHCSKYVN